MTAWLDRVIIVLCRPEGALNVGATCRAMKTMGLRRLSLVAPEPMDVDEVYKMAIHAREIYDGAEVHESLEGALTGTVLSAGTTRRRGVRRKSFSILPEDFAEKAAATAEGDTALVFGNEQGGLTVDELASCNLAVHIPSSPEFPSLNLSHAVQVMTAALWRRAIGEETGSYRPTDREGVEEVVRAIHDALDAAGYFDRADRFYTDRYFRDILARAAMSRREARHMIKVFRKLRYIREDG
jgi:TrmH family RNA methyltransferase